MRWPTSYLLPPIYTVLLVLAANLMLQVRAAFQLPPFLQTLSEQTEDDQATSGINRVYSLPAALPNVPNIRRFTPRKKHLKPQKLLKRLNKDFDAFWMSLDRPQDADLETIRDNITSDPMLAKAVQRLNFTLRSEDGVMHQVDQNVVDMMSAWLLQHSTCRVHYVWDDLGILYWPRWVRRGYCQALHRRASDQDSDSTPTLSSSCSWPPGMHCVPAESRRIKILRWQCRHNKAFNNWNPRWRHRDPDDDDDYHLADQDSQATSQSVKRRKRATVNQTSASQKDESNETENWSKKPWKDRRQKLSMRCKWKKIPYPVTDDCFCSC